MALYDLKSRGVLGGEKFLEAIEPALKEKRFVREIPRCERLASRPSLKDLFEGSFGNEERNVLIRRALLDYSYSLYREAYRAALGYRQPHREDEGIYFVIIQDLTPYPYWIYYIQN